MATAIQAEVATTVVSGLSLVKRHHEHATAPCSTQSSATTSRTSGSYDEDASSFSSRLCDAGTPEDAPCASACVQPRPDRDRATAHGAKYVELNSDRSVGSADAVEELAAPPEALMFRRGGFLDSLGINFLRPYQQGQQKCARSPADAGVPCRRASLLEAFACLDLRFLKPPSLRSDGEQGPLVAKTDPPDNKEESVERRPSSVLQTIADDFHPERGDQKILRAIGRTALVNAVVLVTAAAGGATAVAGFATGGAITSKRIFDGIMSHDEREVTKALAVYGAATAASILGQAAASAVMLGLVGAGLPVATAVAFTVGCVCGIAAGALSEWTVEGLIDTFGEVSDWTIDSVLEALARMATRRLMKDSHDVAATPRAVVA